MECGDRLKPDLTACALPHCVSAQAAPLMTACNAIDRSPVQFKLLTPKAIG